MASSEEGKGRPFKRRRTNQGIRTINIGGKTISLEGYLGPSTYKATKDESRTTNNTPTTETSKESVERHANSKRKDQESNHREDSCADLRLLRGREGLPVWQHKEDIKKALRGSKNNLLVLISETGSGKSTQLPQFLAEEPWCKQRTVKVADLADEGYVGGMVAITQPRRVAAITLAHRVAREAGTPLQKNTKTGKVGYSVRFDHHVPRDAKIKFLTEGTLLKELQRDPYLRQYSAIIVDEFHERSLDVDLVVGFLKQILIAGPAYRGGVPLKIVIMSATVNVKAITDFFADIESLHQSPRGIGVLEIPGRQYPVEIKHEPGEVLRIEDALMDRIFKINSEEPLPGGILAFLVGQENIQAAQKLIEKRSASLTSDVPKLKVLPLYGQLSLEEQQEVFRPLTAKFTRKVILATNIAETSVTIPGVRYVVDCGQVKMRQFESDLELDSLRIQPICQSSAIQRAGRAGREGPGKCYRLYTETSFNGFKVTHLPEICRSDLVSAVLTMKARGIHDVGSFPLIDTPGSKAIKTAIRQLHYLRALNNDNAITSAGQAMASFPLSAPFSAVLLAASEPEYGCVLEAIDIMSCLTAGPDIFIAVHLEEDQEDVIESRKELQRREGDIITYLTTLHQYTAENVDRAQWCKKRRINVRAMKLALQIRKQLRAMCVKKQLLSEQPPADPQPFTPISSERAEALLKCFLRGFAMTSAFLMPDASYKCVSNKRAVAIHPASVLHGRKVEAIMFLENVFTNKNYAKKVSVVKRKWVVDAIEYGL